MRIYNNTNDNVIAERIICETTTIRMPHKWRQDFRRLNRKVFSRRLKVSNGAVSLKSLGSEFHDLGPKKKRTSPQTFNWIMRKVLLHRDGEGPIIAILQRISLSFQPFHFNMYYQSFSIAFPTRSWSCWKLSRKHQNTSPVKSIPPTISFS